MLKTLTKKKKKKKKSQDKTKYSIYEMFRLKLKSFSIYKDHDVSIWKAF